MICEIAKDIIEGTLEFSAEDKARIKGKLLEYVALHSAPDSKGKRDTFAVELDDMMRGLAFKVDGEKLTLVTTPAGEHTLVKLKRGTLWFQGHENVELLILKGYLSE